ncbi:alpha/beta fold hydrolase [Mucilaginibacter celer]|uniref:Alpha/beta fold hydrolase n=1 Tax=Mucilaginibacter celer TaxID=2305508 RepID=A0A494VY89_9SPHI|nr:alpha/beta hydrolase [Mucilaginibacter celer]AYL99081.1 alpha/beta fold hydrolase [Mucilaginibacter celer]
MITTEVSNNTRTSYHKVQIDGLEIFYRQAGNLGKPLIFLLHGFPSSSHMFRNLIEQLSDDYCLIAPDYPGFGYSSCPHPAKFDYTFDRLSEIVEKLIDELKLSDITFYMQDYGGPIGFRVATRRPELIKGLIIQNANAFEEGIGPDVQKIGTLHAAGDWKALNRVVDYMMSLEGIKEQYIFGTANAGLISPDSYYTDYFLIMQPGRIEVQKILFENYGTNFPLYPEWQQYLKEHQPPTLVAWGNNDKIFPGAGAMAYRQVLPQADVHLFDGGHFLLEEYSKEVAVLIKSFMQSNAGKL